MTWLLGAGRFSADRALAETGATSFALEMLPRITRAQKPSSAIEATWMRPRATPGPMPGWHPPQVVVAPDRHHLALSETGEGCRGLGLQAGL